jgi:CRP-like cAMP-binding protein
VVAIVGQVVSEAEIPNVARQPAPSCVLMEFGAGYGRYALRYWLTDPQQDDPTDSLVRIHVFAALERAGMHLAIPEEARHLIKENEAREQARASREQRHREALLARVDILKSLTGEERTTLAGCLAHAPFARGDIITRQGAESDWLYILVAGEAEVWFEREGERRLLSTLGPGHVFGEMGLLTGEPRRATVVAKSDVDCYRLDKMALEEILRGRPTLADELSRVLAEREAELDRARQDFDESARLRDKTDRHASILARMRSFLRL